MLNCSRATGANRRMPRICADIGFPVPAALALLPVGFLHRDLDLRAVGFDDFELGDVEQFLQGSLVGGGFGQFFRWS